MKSQQLAQTRLGVSSRAWAVLPVVLGCALFLPGCGGSKSSSNIAPVVGGGVAPSCSAAPAAGAAPSSISGGLLGMHINHASTPWPDQPVAGLRMWDDGSSWALVNTSPGTYDWSAVDHWLALAQTNGADVVYDLARTPVWAQCSASDTQCGSGNTAVHCAYSSASNSPEGGDGQCFPPADLNVDGTGPNQHWIDWVTAVASHSVNSTTAHIKYYEIWNEPNEPAFWQGTSAQLVRMAQDARCIIKGSDCNTGANYPQKGLDPSAVLLTPAFTASSTSDVATAMDTYLTAGGGQCADVVAFHGYLGQNAPEHIATIYSNLAGVLASQPGKAIFNTEASWGVNHPITDPDQQTAWLSRYIIVQASLGVSRFYWYAWDIPGVNLWDSTTNADTPAGIAYGQMNSWLNGATISACTQNSANTNIWQCAITRSGGYQALAMWDTSQTCSSGSCTTAPQSAPAPYTQYVDVAGNVTAISGGTVPLGIKPILLENGNIP